MQKLQTCLTSKLSKKDKELISLLLQSQGKVQISMSGNMNSTLYPELCRLFQHSGEENMCVGREAMEQ